MTPQELKNSILQLAIQGKLVEQRAEEGTGRELLEKILAAKNAKDAERGKGKSHAKSAKSAKCSGSQFSPISDDEKPFDIPDSWEWVRLGELVFNHGQKKPTDDFSYIDIGSIDNRRQKLSSSETIIHPQDASPRARKIVFKGDVLYATVRPYLHNICIIDREFSCEPIASTGFAVMACTSCLDNKFLFYFLLSPDFDRYANSSENAKGVAYPAISDKRLYGALIPLPPLAEQKRIVAKIEELLPLIDRYEKAWSRLESFNKSFPVDMQKSILQMAIQGKLVEQRAEEGTGRELLEKILAAKNAKDAEKGKGRGRLTRSRGDRGDALSSAPSASPRDEIPDDEKPFDIPESWEWVRLGDVVNSLTDGTHRTPKYATTGIKFVSVKNMSGGFLSFDNTKFITLSEHEELIKRCHPERGDMLLSKVGTTGVPAIVDTDEPFSIFVSVALLKYNHNFLDERFLYYLLKSPLVQMQAEGNTRGVGNKNWVLDAIAKTMVVLPPLAEQKRIVAKLEELLPLCERLK